MVLEVKRVDVCGNNVYISYIIYDGKSESYRLYESERYLFFKKINKEANEMNCIPSNFFVPFSPIWIWSVR